MAKIKDLKEKIASVVSSEEESDELVEKTFKKLAEKTEEIKKAEGGNIHPAKMVEKSEGLTEKEKEALIEAIHNLEAKQEALSEGQNNKIAAIRDNYFEANGAPARGELFEKVASKVLLNCPRIVMDHNFQKYENLKGEEQQFPLQSEHGEIVNHFLEG